MPFRINRGEERKRSEKSLTFSDFAQKPHS